MTSLFCSPVQTQQQRWCPHSRHHCQPWYFVPGHKIQPLLLGCERLQWRARCQPWGKPYSQWKYRLHSRATVGYGTTLPFEIVQYLFSASAAVEGITENVAFRVSPLVEDPSIVIDGVALASGSECSRGPRQLQGLRPVALESLSLLT